MNLTDFSGLSGLWSVPTVFVGIAVVIIVGVTFYAAIRLLWNVCWLLWMIFRIIVKKPGKFDDEGWA